MQKTSVYLPPELKRALAKLAAERGCSEAMLIRDALTKLTASEAAPAPRLPLFRSKGPSIAERIDGELAKGFGR